MLRPQYDSYRVEKINTVVPRLGTVHLAAEWVMPTTCLGAKMAVKRETAMFEGQNGR